MPGRIRPSLQLAQAAQVDARREADDIAFTSYHIGYSLLLRCHQRRPRPVYIGAAYHYPRPPESLLFASCNSTVRRGDWRSRRAWEGTCKHHPPDPARAPAGMSASTVRRVGTPTLRALAQRSHSRAASETSRAEGGRAQQALGGRWSVPALPRSRVPSRTATVYLQPRQLALDPRIGVANHSSLGVRILWSCHWYMSPRTCRSFCSPYRSESHSRTSSTRRNFLLLFGRFRRSSDLTTFCSLPLVSRPADYPRRPCHDDGLVGASSSSWSAAPGRPSSATSCRRSDLPSADLAEQSQHQHQSYQDGSRARPGSLVSVLGVATLGRSSAAWQGRDLEDPDGRLLWRPSPWSVRS